MKQAPLPLLLLRLLLDISHLFRPSARDLFPEYIYIWGVGVSLALYQ